MASEKTFKIESPNSGFSGVREGVVFNRGKGEGTEEQARNLARRGYAAPGLEDANDRSGEAPHSEGILQITGVGEATAEKLSSASAGTLEELATADPAVVAEKTGLPSEKVEAWQDAAAALVVPAPDEADPEAASETTPPTSKPEQA